MAAVRPGRRGRRALGVACALAAAGGLALVAGGVAGGSPPPSPAGAASGRAVPPAPPSPSASARGWAPEQLPVDVLPASAPTRVSIPDLGVDAALVRLDLDASGAMAVPGDGAAVGWYDRSPTPGQVGPTVLAGHVSWDRRPAVFFELGALRAGQRVTVRREDGASVTYRVTGVQQYPKDAFPSLQVYGNTTAPELRLITCGGEFNSASGHHRDDVVVYAVLDSVARA